MHTSNTHSLHMQTLLVGLTCVGLCTEIPSETHVRPHKKRNIETELHLIMDGDPQCESAPQTLFHAKENEGLDGDLGTFSISAIG